MNKEWIAGTEGHNLKFKRETLLNYGMNRWGLNKAYSVGSTSELIRACAPKTFDEWEDFYQWVEMHRKNHERFKNDFGGHVFFVYSVKGAGKKKKIYNTEVIDRIIEEIDRLR